MSSMHPHVSLEYRDAAAPHYYLISDNQSFVDAFNLFMREIWVGRTNVNTVRTYAYALLDWFRYAQAEELQLEDVRRSNIVNYVLRLQGAANPQRAKRSPSSPKPGSVNEHTGKKHLPEGYQASTIALRISVLRRFFEILIAEGRGPATSPVPPAGRGFRPEKNQIRYRRISAFVPSPPQRSAHAIPEALLKRFRSEARCARDSALIECLYSTGARAAEVIAITYEDVLWKEQAVFLQTKGRAVKEKVAASRIFFERLKVYLDERGERLRPGDYIWVVRRGATRPMTYPALRAVIQGMNRRFGSNVTLHDFRSTCAVQMARNPLIPLLTIRDQMRHTNLSTTQRYMDSGRIEDFSLLQKHLDDDSHTSLPIVESVEYDQDDLATIFGHINERGSE